VAFVICIYRPIDVLISQSSNDRASCGPAIFHGDLASFFERQMPHGLEDRSINFYACASGDAPHPPAIRTNLTEVKP
jgi:hypothetical protein